MPFRQYAPLFRFWQGVPERAQFLVLEGNFQHSIDEVFVIVEFDQCLLEQLDLHIEVHAGWAVEADQPA